MSNPHDKQAALAVLRAVGRLRATELAKILHWPVTRTRLALIALENDGIVAHNPDRSWGQAR